MEKIMIHREEQDYGPYSLEQARELASQGVLVGNDLAWMEGTTTWVPLENLFSEGTPVTPEVAATALLVPPPTEIKAESPKAAGKWAYAILFGVVLAFLAIGAVAVYDVKTVVTPLLAVVTPAPAPGDPANKTRPADHAFDVTTSTEGDSIAATIMTDDSHRPGLCDEVMAEIYSLASKNATASTITVIVQIDGGKSAKIQIDDLAEVRCFSNKNDYVKSEHRDFIGGLLVSAEVIDAIPAPANVGG